MYLWSHIWGKFKLIDVYMQSHIAIACMVHYRFEVGVRVEGFAVGGERRHINSAFFIYRPCDENVTLPKLIPDSQVHRIIAALASIIARV